MGHFLAHWLGLDNPAGPVYSFYSGVGSDLGELVIVGVIWHHLNCREAGCRRMARHKHDGYCGKHKGEKR